MLTWLQISCLRVVIQVVMVLTENILVPCLDKQNIGNGDTKNKCDKCVWKVKEWSHFRQCVPKHQISMTSVFEISFPS